MATTSPDNIWTPNSDDQYALVQDLAATATSVQSALDRRANTYKGTSTQRQAFTTAPNGVLWQDTNGSQLLYVRRNNAWQTVVPETTQATYSFSTPFTPHGGSYTSSVQPTATRSGDWVEVRGVAGLSNSNTITGSSPVTMFTLGAAFRPPESIFPSRMQGSGDHSWLLRVGSDGVVGASRYSVAGTSGLWLPFQVTYFSPRP